MAFKRSAVRFRLAPPSSLRRTLGSLVTLRKLPSFRDLRDSFGAITVSTETLAARFRCHPRCSLRASKKSSQNSVGTNAETGSSVERDGFFSGVRWRFTPNDEGPDPLAQPAQQVRLANVNRRRVAAVAEPSRQGGRSSARHPDREAVCRR